METIKNKLSEIELEFFEELSKYLEITLYFFGSVQRNDYFPGSSDIDVDIFTDNEKSTIAKMQHFLHVEHKAFKKFIWRLNDNNKLVRGYKIMYKNKQHNFSAEFSIYNKKNKEEILKEHNRKINIPFYISYVLILLKILYYNLHIINSGYYRYFKKKALSVGLGLPDDDFVVIDTKK